MRSCPKRLLTFSLLLLFAQHVRGQSARTGVPPPSSSRTTDRSTFRLWKTRKSPSDLEVGGDLAGLPRGVTRYIAREDLLTLPQVTFNVTDDTNFAPGTAVSGVRLEELAKQIAATPDQDMGVAVCDDKYRANYPRSYVAAHHPVLVLNVNGQAPAGWPKDSQEHKYDMGPYMISHDYFIPGFKILSHADEPQIPWGVVRIEFRNEQSVFSSIEPHGANAKDEAIQAGNRIARQNCFRCHNSGREGGQKSGIDWQTLGDLAALSPKWFGEYIRNPKSKKADSQMQEDPAYDDATLNALAAYFKTFREPAKP